MTPPHFSKFDFFQNPSSGRYTNVPQGSSSLFSRCLAEGNRIFRTRNFPPPKILLSENFQNVSPPNFPKSYPFKNFLLRNFSPPNFSPSEIFPLQNNPPSSFPGDIPPARNYPPPCIRISGIFPSAVPPLFLGSARQLTSLVATGLGGLCAAVDWAATLVGATGAPPCSEGHTPFRLHRLRRYSWRPSILLPASHPRLRRGVCVGAGCGYGGHTWGLRVGPVPPNRHALPQREVSARAFPHPVGCASGHPPSPAVPYQNQNKGLLYTL